jgi:hypothetical protein
MSKPGDESRRKAAERAKRDKRLAAALRENLRRRKEQARAQGTAKPGGGEEKPQDST